MDDELVNDEFIECHKVYSSKQLLVQFIELYAAIPELWNSSSTAYMNKMKRNQALDKLLVIYKKIKTDTKREDVRKKYITHKFPKREKKYFVKDI